MVLAKINPLSNYRHFYVCSIYVCLSLSIYLSIYLSVYTYVHIQYSSLLLAMDSNLQQCPGCQQLVDAQALTGFCSS